MEIVPIQKNYRISIEVVIKVYGKDLKAVYFKKEIDLRGLFVF